MRVAGQPCTLEPSLRGARSEAFRDTSFPRAPQRSLSVHAAYYRQSLKNLASIDLAPVQAEIPIA